MNCLVKAIARQKVTQLKGTVSKAFSSIPSYLNKKKGKKDSKRSHKITKANEQIKDSISSNIQARAQTKTQRHKFKVSITKKTKKLLHKLRKMITMTRSSNDTPSKTTVENGSVKSRFDFI